MPDPIPEGLFLRDPRNRAFVAGNRNTYRPRYPDNVHPAIRVVTASTMLALTIVIAIGASGYAFSSALFGCIPRPALGCVIVGPVLVLFVAVFPVLMAVATWKAITQAMLLPGRVRRLREEGVIIYGKITDYTPWKFQRGDESPDFYELTLHYSLPVAAQEAVHEEVIYRAPASDLKRPSSDSRVAVVYVDEGLWELL